MKNFNYNIFIFIFLFYTNKINCISDDAIRKYIELDNSYFTYTLREENYGEKIVYIFTISQKICTEIIIIDDDDDSSSISGKVNLYNDEHATYTIASSDLNKNNRCLFYPDPNGQNLTFYLEYYYPKKNKIVINFRFYLINLNLHKYNFDLKYSEYNLGNDDLLFISIPLNDLNSNQYLSLKVTGDLKDNLIKYYEGYKTDTPETIGQQGYNVDKTLEYIKLSDDIYIFHYKISKNQDKSNIVLQMVGKNYKQNVYVASIKISVIYRQDIQSSIMGSNFKYSGNFLAANLNNFNLNEDIICIMYTNITNILNVYGIENSEIEDYKFGDNNGIDIYSNEKVSFINLSQEKKSKNIDTIIFEIKNAEESYNFQLIFVSSNEYNIELNNYDARQEKIQFFREIDSSNFLLNSGKKNIIINNYSSSNEKYLHFIDLFYGEVKYAIANLDTENFGDILESQYSVSPHIINGSVDIKYLYAEKNFYGYNEYFIKCDSHNETNLNLGEFIIICLENNNKTEIYMPSGSFLYTISLPIQQNIDETYKIEFNDMNEKKTLNKNDKEYQNTWDYSKSNKITIENNNDYYVIVFLKTELNSGINKIYESISGSTNLQSNTLYALQLPKNSNNGEIYGVYQEIFSGNQISNICIFHSIIKNEFFSIPPDASCYNSQKNSFNLNVTSHGIKDKLTDNQYFYTFIYYNSQSNNKNINLFYKHMIISENALESKTFLTPSSYNIIYYPINKKTDDTLLFTEIIPKEIQTNVYPISIENKNTTLFTFFKTIEILNYSDKSSCAKLININGKTPYIKIWDITIESLFLYESGNKLTYNYINDKRVFSEIIEADPRDYYLLNFKPFETDGYAKYDIYIFNGSSGYTLNDLNNTYYIYKNFLDENSSNKINYYNKTSYNSLKSTDGDFDDNIKEQFILNLTGPKNTVFDILVISQKENPSSYKIYNAYEIILDGIRRRKKINLNTTLEQTYCFNQEILTDEKFVLTITKISDDDSLKDGSLIIQLINKNKSMIEQNFNVYSLREGSEKIYTSSNLNTFSYTLNTEKVGDIFDITYDTDYEAEIKMCLEFIPSPGKQEFNEIIEYKYMTSVNLTYYVDTSIYNNILEIFRFNYDQSKIKNMTIYTDFYDSNKKILLSEKFEENYLKIIEDNKKYLGIYSTINKKIICITVCIEVKSNYDINDNLDSFYIERMQTIDNTNNLQKIEITIEENPKFYIYDLNSILTSQQTLLFFTDLINYKGFNIYRNNYFSKNYEQISLPLYPFTLSNETNTTTENGDVNILTLVTYKKQGSKEGFIDFTKRDEKFVVGENCDKEEFFESELELIYDQISFLCYHENPSNEKYNVSYTVEGPENNIIYTFFTNKVLFQSSLSDIILEINNNRLKQYTTENKEFNIINENSKLDIFKYFYFWRLDNTSNNKIIFKKWKYDENQEASKTEEEYEEEEEGTDHGALIYAIMFLSTFIVVIGIFSFKNVNEKDKSNLSEKTNSSGTLDNSYNSSFLSKSKIYKMN